MPKGSVLLTVASLLLACNNETERPVSTAPENDVDAATTFIRYALNGNYKAAQNLIVPDSANKEWLAAAERTYLHSDVTRQRGLRESSITIRDTKKLNDSISVITYFNSFFKERNERIKVVKRSGSWLVDLKYTFETTDSTHK